MNSATLRSVAGLAALCLSLVATFAACSSDDPAGDGGDSTGTTGDGDGDGDGDGGDPLPNGSQCSLNSDCESGFCYSTPFAGVCSECSTDADCVEAGTGLNCTLGDQGYFVCGQGEIGEFCESDDGCGDPLVCGVVAELGGFFTLQTCGECNESTPCTGDQICNPSADFSSTTNVSGQNSCVDPGTVTNDSLCNPGPDGDAACIGYCNDTPINIMGTNLGSLGVCGDCRVGEMDCAEGESCTAGSIGFGTSLEINGSVCG